MQLSTNVKIYRIFFYSDRELPSKYVDISEKQRMFIMGVWNNYKKTGRNSPVTVGDISFSVSNIKMIDKIKDDTYLNSAYRQSYNVKNKVNREKEEMTIEESRKWAKSLGIKNTAWECGNWDCLKWSPYLILKCPETGNPKADFICKHCGK